MFSSRDVTLSIRYIDKKQFLLAYAGWDFRYRRPGPEVERIFLAKQILKTTGGLPALDFNTRCPGL